MPRPGVDVTIEQATLEHALALARVMRAADKAEARALDLQPLEALLEALDKSEVAFAVSFNGELAALFGVAPFEPHTQAPPSTAVVWMLSGEAVDRYPKAFARASRAVMPKLLEHYELLVNVIDARYTRALRWARWLGFDVREARPFGPHAMPFHPCSARRTTWV
jgi:hypothetical protein